MKDTLKMVGWLALGFIAALGCVCLGNLAYPLPGAVIGFYVCAACALAVTIWGIINAFSHDEGPREKVAERRQHILDAEAKVQQNAGAERKKVDRLYHRVWMTWAALTLMWIALGFLGGAAYGVKSGGFVGMVLVDTLFLASMIRFALYMPDLPSAGSPVNPKDYPKLTALVKEVRAQVGHTRHIRMCIGGVNVGVARMRFCDELTFAPLLLSMLTREELRQILLHEFDHLVNPELAVETKWRLTMRRDEVTTNDALMLGYFPMLRAMGRFCAQVNEYCQLSSVALERAADDRIRAQGSPNLAASAILKAALLGKFQQEDLASAYRYFAPEQPQPNLNIISKEIYRDMIGQYGEIWIREIEQRLPGHAETHPTFAQRCQALGADHYDPFSVEPDADWRVEMDALCDFEDRERLQSPNYSALRQNLYLARKSQMEAFEQADDPLNTLDTEMLLDAAVAYEGLDASRVLEILEAVLAREPRNGHARLLYGVHLRRMRDDRCFEQLYRAAENSNYTMEALMMLDEAAHESGDPERVREFDERATELLQSAEDFEDGFEKIDIPKLKECTLPEPVLRQIVGKMEELGRDCLAAIDCASKPLGENRDGHIFVLKFFEDADAERSRKVAHSIFELLDQREEMYALREDDELSMDQLEKYLPRSRVYTGKR